MQADQWTIEVTEIGTGEVVQTIPCRDQKHAEREVKHIRLGDGLYKTRIVPPKEKSNAG